MYEQLTAAVAASAVARVETLELPEVTSMSVDVVYSMSLSLKTLVTLRAS